MSSPAMTHAIQSLDDSVASTSGGSAKDVVDLIKETGVDIEANTDMVFNCKYGLKLPFSRFMVTRFDPLKAVCEAAKNERMLEIDVSDYTREEVFFALNLFLEFPYIYNDEQEQVVSQRYAELFFTEVQMKFKCGDEYSVSIQQFDHFISVARFVHQWLHDGETCESDNVFRWVLKNYETWFAITPEHIIQLHSLKHFLLLHEIANKMKSDIWFHNLGNEAKAIWFTHQWQTHGTSTGSAAFFVSFFITKAKDVSPVNKHKMVVHATSATSATAYVKKRKNLSSYWNDIKNKKSKISMDDVIEYTDDSEDTEDEDEDDDDDFITED